jgi:hypothetical protein
VARSSKVRLQSRRVLLRVRLLGNDAVAFAEQEISLGGALLAYFSMEQGGLLLDAL